MEYDKVRDAVRGTKDNFLTTKRLNGQAVASHSGDEQTVRNPPVRRKGHRGSPV